MWLRWTALVCWLAACKAGDSDTGMPDANTHVPCHHEGAGGDSVWDELSSGYSTIETIAGTGLITEKGDDGWQDAFEGVAATEAELSRPHMTQADPEGRLYVADKDAHAIRRIDLDGTIHTLADADDGLDGPNGLFVADDGTVYILEALGQRVRRLDEDGTLTTLFEDDALVVGRGLWVQADEDLVYYSSGDRLMRWTPQDESTIYASGFAELGNLDVSPDGVLTATDRDANQVVAVYGQNHTRIVAGNGGVGKVTETSLACETPLHGVRGIWFHPDGGYFLGTHEGNQVLFVDEDQRVQVFLDGERDAHDGDGELWSSEGLKISEVRSVTLDADHNVIVTENDGGFIRRVGRNAP